MDEARFHAEYERVSDQLYTFLVRATGDADRASDIFQEAVYKAFRARNRFRGDSSFKTWIYRIAINTLKNERARWSREKSWMRLEAREDQAREGTPEEILTRKQTAAALETCLTLLEEGYKVPFLLKHIDGLSYREIAEVTDLEESTARVRVYRARQALMALLKGSA